MTFGPCNNHSGPTRPVCSAVGWSQGRTARSRDMDMKQRARELLRRLEAAIAANQLVLPSLPEVVIRVRALTESGNCSVEELEREISRDPAIAARLVKVANSSIMRRGVPVSSVRQAIVLLGFRLVRSMVTQLALLQTMGRAGGDPGRLRGFVEGGLHISALCRDLRSEEHTSEL